MSTKDRLKIRRGGWLLLFCLTGLLSSAADPVRPLRRLFANPPREYASAPLWVWNDLLTEDQIRGAMRELAGQSVKQVFVHPRPGLMTPYLSADWFRLWNVALREAERLDMNVWIYDENSYPSGFAGGFVPEKMPESRGLGLSIDEAKGAPKVDDDFVGWFRVSDQQAEDLTAEVRAGRELPGGGTYLAARLLHAGNSPWHGNRSYVNLLTPGVTEKFLEVTLGAYDRGIAGQGWKRIPGVFTDEPNIRPAGGFPWCADLPDQFKKRWGYDLMPQLSSLVREVGDWRRVRHNYYSLLSQLFIERWAKPYYEACDKRGLEFTGHYWDHEWPHCVGVPDNMAMAAWQHRPGIDTLMNQYAENTHAQFGNVRFCREISSVANQLGRERTLVELYGAGGWDLRFEDMKRIADWLQVLGINTMDEHLSYVTLRGARKRDHPQSFSYHEPWWPAYHVHARYMTRLSAALSQGQQVNRVLVLEPTTTAWMYQGSEEKLKQLGDGFFQLLMSLESAQIEYDLGCEDVIARQGSLASATSIRHSWTATSALKIGQRAYEIVVLPPHVENLDDRTWALLRDFAVGGGRVLSCVEPPERINGTPRLSETHETSWRRRWERVDATAVAGLLRAEVEKGKVVVQRAEGDQGILFHHRREVEGGEILFLVNTSIEHGSRGVVRASLPAAERWDPYTGKTEAYPVSETQGGVLAPFDLPPSGSLLLFLAEKAPRKSVQPQKAPQVVDLRSAPVTTRRLGPNVLTLDYVDVTAGGESLKGQYFYEANQRVWKTHGMDRNPWDSAVQFEDELIRKTFPAGSGFEVAYRFEIEGSVPQDLAIVIERPDLYRIECNGTPIEAKVSDWWLDRAFGRLPIAVQARTGENEIRLRAGPFQILHEIEPAYLLGSFRLKGTERGWAVIPDEALSLGWNSNGGGGTGQGLGWNDQGHPFYSEGVVYRHLYHVTERTGQFRLALARWYGAVAKVVINGHEAGWVTAPPWDCDVTPWVKRGENEVEITVIGTLKNTLGPHHGNHRLGSAWPGMFQKGPNPGPPPGSRYATVSYGLFEPAVLRQLTPAR
ncbi:MAG: hypothetical protein IT581_08195 [Verrucomicrobiales bacterium]|nr:hypothetical protein [Verrucomicrobiales bacterium]